MTPKRACEILRAAWGDGEPLHPAVEAEIQGIMLRGDGYLDALQRIAGDRYDWRDRGQSATGYAMTPEARNHFRQLTPRRADCA